MTREAPAATPIAFIQAMLLAYEKYGDNPEPALKRARIALQHVKRADTRITAEQMEIFSECAMRDLDDETLGWFGRRLRWGTYGMLARASITSPNLGVALRRWCRHHRLVVDDVAPELRTFGGYAELIIEERSRIESRLRDFCLLSLMRYVHGLACWMIDSRIPVRAVTFPHPPPPHWEMYRLMFPGPVSFDAATASFSFDADYLALPLRRDEASLRVMLRRALPLTVRQYRRDRLLVQRVRDLLTIHSTADGVADALNISVRTLHRQLKKEGTSLQEEKDRLRRDRAIDLLLRTNRSIKQIAHAASFTNECSFTRAFRDWTGESPSDYRRKNAERK